jgi:hypothetical protein
MFKRAQVSLALVLVSTMFVACAGTGSTSTGSTSQPVPITDFKMVAGKWGGLLEGITARQEDYVDLTITPDGKYDFGIYRTIGGFSGSGTLTLAGGKMEGRGERGTTTYTLYQSGAKRTLKVQGTLSDGRQLSATLNPKE